MFTGAILAVVSPRPLFGLAGAVSAIVALIALRSLRRHGEVPEAAHSEGAGPVAEPPLAVTSPDLGR